jgi:hypothetical protein
VFQQSWAPARVLLLVQARRARVSSPPIRPVSHEKKKKKKRTRKRNLWKGDFVFTETFAAVPSKAVKAAVGKPAVPPQPKKASTMKKTVNYERQMGVVTAPPTGQTVAHQQRKHSDTLASMPMQDKMKVAKSAFFLFCFVLCCFVLLCFGCSPDCQAFESAGAADSRRNFWIKRAEEKKAVAAKPKAPVGQAPRPPATKAPTPQRPSEKRCE